MNSSSSDDDLYDNFEKYKKKHKSVKSTLTDVFIQTRPIDAVEKACELLSLPKDVNAIKTSVTENKKDNSLIDFDAEFADIPSVKPIMQKTARDERLKDILREARFTLDSFEQRAHSSAPEGEQVSDDGAAEKRVFRRRCTLNLINSKDGHSFIVRCDMDEPFKNIMKSNAERLQIEPSKLVFMGRDRRYYDEDTPLNVGLDENNVHDIDVYEEFESNKVSLKWLLKGRKPITIYVSNIKTFNDLKREFCVEQNLNHAKTRLIFDSERLNGDETPQSLNMEDGDCIDVYVDEN